MKFSLFFFFVVCGGILFRSLHSTAAVNAAALLTSIESPLLQRQTKRTTTTMKWDSNVALQQIRGGESRRFFHKNKRQTLFLSKEEEQPPESDGLSKSSNSSSSSWDLLRRLFGFEMVWPASYIYLAISMALWYFYSIPQRDIVFSIFFPLYLGLANRFRFNLNSLVACTTPKVPLRVNQRGSWFPTYLLSFGIVGLLLPLLLVVLAPQRNVALAAAPHFYLVSCQVLMETLTRSPYFHEIPRVLLPIGFNAYRIGSLMEWVTVAYQMYRTNNMNNNPAIPTTSIWPLLGFLLAVCNLVAWSYNLFVFLLLRVLPEYVDAEAFPSSPVQWKGQLFPVVCNNEKKDD